MKFINLSGLKFGRLTVIKRVENIKGRTAFLCKCECGNLVEVTGHNLKMGNTKSCGCLAAESREKSYKKLVKSNRIKPSRYKHGLSNHRLHKIWDNMKDRCYREKSPAYKNYGARGIKLCQEWLDDFMNFYNWAINNGYKDNLSIDRIDVNGNYEPNNCRWATIKEQANNTRQCKYYIYKGIKYTRAQLAEMSNISYFLLRYRLNSGWNLQDALSIKPFELKRYAK